MKKQKLMKIRLEKVQRTDLICIACNCFRTDWAIVPGPGVEPVAGVHSKCIASMHVKHTRKAPESPVPEESAKSEVTAS
ncbi:MAG TPA: hypothetical protein VFA98_11225 [Thermoanaerobaculia bacterium]|nr:hypothetical protein [Thermoanaerobaculia bacterium]